MAGRIRAAAGSALGGRVLTYFGLMGIRCATGRKDPWLAGMVIAVQAPWKNLGLIVGARR
jgi:hypothetical protein